MNAKIEFKEKMLQRTLQFSLDIIKELDKVPKNQANIVITNQLLRSGTSIGANYREACEAESSKDFVHKIKILLKEAKESVYWLELLTKSNNIHKTKLEKLSKEVDEFIKIFSKILSKFK